MAGLASKLRPRARTLQAIRASVLASAIARTLRCSRFLAASIHGLSPCRSQLCGLISTTHAACTNRTRRYRLPRFDILPRRRHQPATQRASARTTTVCYFKCCVLSLGEGNETAHASGRTLGRVGACLAQAVRRHEAAHQFRGLMETQAIEP